ncbi:MAG: transglycosylase SLT domain-containing protein [Saprospiraceae bacterium]|nr:transglycosylase SLT domain-containing protein [Saprospiraceae bacterium]
MEPGSLQKILTVLFLSLFLPSLSFGNPYNGSIELELEYDENSVAERMLAMPDMTIRPRRDPVAMGYIRNYLTRSRRTAELIIGRSILYFPMFDEHLKRYNLPKELKYLPVVESALNPKAVSRAGAGGLWQFMPGTGKMEGLQSNKYIDERFDPIKSTEAAMRHLSRLYEMFGDWELALAAYNSGSGNVTRAVKRGRSQDFWRIQRYLPRETRNYVPAFMAATYLCEHFLLHGIEPAVPEMDMQITESIKVYNAFSFFELATLTGLSIETLESLNPAYVGGYIPENANGYYLTLPRRVMPAVLEFLAAKLPDNSDPEPIFAGGPVALYNSPGAESYYYEHTYTVEENDEFKTIESLAEKLDCTPQHLRIWNRLNTANLVPGQQWKYFGPKAYKRMSLNKMPIVEAPMALPFRQVDALEYTSSIETACVESDDENRYLFIAVTGAERLPEIARRYEGVSVDDLRRLNRVMGNPVFRGRLVKIKEF